MQIETVKETKSGYVLNGVCSVPKDSGNSDYKAIQSWIAEGGEVESYDSLPDEKIEKLAEIKTARDVFMYADVEYNGSTFTNSLVSGNNLIAAITLSSDSISWLDSSGATVNLTIAEAKELAKLISEKRSLGYFTEASLQSKVNACTTLDQLNAIQFTF